jgi:hypothetical protein
LSVEQGGGHAHRVYADQCGFCWIDGIVGQAVSDLEAAKVGEGDGNGGGWHYLVQMKVCESSECAGKLEEGFVSLKTSLQAFRRSPTPV